MAGRPLRRERRAQDNPEIRFRKAKTQEDMRAGVRNSLQPLVSDLQHLEGLIAAHGVYDEEIDATFRDIWSSIRDIPRR